jgi:hypothetical protein
VGIPIKFSHQTILSSVEELEITSINPSPSTSSANIEIIPLMLLEMTCSVKFSEPSFSHQDNVVSRSEADKISISPSLSISIANTELAPLAMLEMTCSVKFSEPSFSHHAIVSSL